MDSNAVLKRPIGVKPYWIAGVLSLLVVLGAACSSDPESAEPEPSVAITASSIPSEQETAPLEPAPAPTISTTALAPTTTTEPPRPAWPADGVEPGSEGPIVELLQTGLEALGFRTGDAVDGVYGSGTTSAVMAFEKFEGLPRDGVADPEMLAALAAPTGIKPLKEQAGAPRIEIDLERQILFARDMSGEIRVLNTSTGNGEQYKSSSGNYVRATTPTGEYAIERRIDGVRKAFLGSLYRPLYFKRGWAIHGSNSVPAYPASHGCARLRNDDQDWMFETFSDGTEVSVYEFTPELAPQVLLES